MINYERVEKALTRLAETDQVLADRKADVESLKYQCKAIHSAIFSRLEGTVKEREALADNHDNYRRSMENYFKAISLYEGLRNERHKEELIIEVWRSINSARNKGQVI